jgi:hypothetical protein
VSKVYKEYARNGTVEDIHQGYWKMIGKVIKKIDSNNIFDFMKDSPFSFLPDSLLSNMLKSMDNEVFKLPKIENKIEEESLVIAPIGIYI